MVQARLPLSEADWALLPSPCPGLLPALPAALACPLEQARQLVSRPPAVDKERLRDAARQLGQSGSGMHAPGCLLPQRSGS